MKAERWFLLESGASHFAFNMALDEALLEAMPRLGIPVLRFYSWSEPVASFGYFQRYVEVEQFTPLRPLVRRPTAGGIVPHDGDWTYSLLFPPSHAWYGLPAVESYRSVHEWIKNALARLDVATQLAPASKKESPGQCFIGYEQFDLLWNGRKIAGAAQRRRRDGLLIQGSFQPSALPLNRAGWRQAMQRAGEDRFAIQWSLLEPDERLLQRAAELASTKYGREDYNRRR